MPFKQNWFVCIEWLIIVEKKWRECFLKTKKTLLFLKHKLTKDNQYFLIFYILVIQLLSPFSFSLTNNSYLFFYLYFMQIIDHYVFHRCILLIDLKLFPWIYCIIYNIYFQDWDKFRLKCIFCLQMISFSVSF